MTIREYTNMQSRHGLDISKTNKDFACKSGAYSKVALKIAYETAVLWFGYSYCDDVIGNEIRNSLDIIAHIQKNSPKDDIEYAKSSVSAIINKYERLSGFGEVANELYFQMQSFARYNGSPFIHYIWATIMENETWITISLEGLPQVSVHISYKDLIRDLPHNNIGVRVIGEGRGAINWIHPDMVKIMPQKLRDNYLGKTRFSR